MENEKSKEWKSTRVCGLSYIVLRRMREQMDPTRQKISFCNGIPFIAEKTYVDKVKDWMKDKVHKILPTVFMFVLVAGAIRIYDDNWELKGYIQDGKIYDKSWELKGYIQEPKLQQQPSTPNYYFQSKPKENSTQRRTTGNGR